MPTGLLQRTTPSADKKPYWITVEATTTTTQIYTHVYDPSKFCRMPNQTMRHHSEALEVQFCMEIENPRFADNKQCKEQSYRNVVGMIWNGATNVRN